MAKNDFKAFATDRNANVMSQEEWEALPALLSGFTAGKASSAQVNKVIRQASFITAALAQFVSDKTQRDVLDNGDLPGFVELLGSGFAVEYLSRKNPFGDIKSDGTVKTALENLQLRESFSGVVGEARNAQMNIIRSSAFASFSADEIIVESSIGQQYRLRAFNKTIDLRMSGTGGMDVGKAPSEGFIALYAILNPTSGETALLAVNATTIIAPEIYAGNHMPDGYTASALVSVWKTDLARNFVAGFQNGRHVVMNSTNVLTTALPAESYTELSIANAVPLNAKTIDGYINVNPVIASINSYCSIASDLSGIGVKSFGTSSSGILANFSDLHLITPQKIYYTIGVAGDMKDSFVNLTGYKI